MRTAHRAYRLPEPAAAAGDGTPPLLIQTARRLGGAMAYHLLEDLPGMPETNSLRSA